jgi:hypothetical protein
MSRIDTPPGEQDKGNTPFVLHSNAIKREVEVRQRVLSVFNKEEDDFDNKREFDDYLEEREDIMFNLVQGVDVKEMEARIKSYQEKNAESIAKNEARRLQRILATGGQYEGGKGKEDIPVAEASVGMDDRTMQMISPEQLDGVLRKQTKEDWGEDGRLQRVVKEFL